MRRGAYPVWLFLNGAGSLFGMLSFTVAAVYFVTVVGMNPLELVLVGTVMELAIFIFEIPTGVVADTFSRKLSIVIGQVVQGAAFVLVGLVPEVWAVLLGYAIWGFGYTFESGALEAWISDEMGGTDLQRVFLRGSQFGYAGAFLGIFGSVALASVDLRLPIVIGGILVAALGPVLALTMPETAFRPAPRGERTSWQAMGATASTGVRLVRTQPILLTLFGFSAIWGMWTEGFDRLWEAHFLVDIGLPSLGDLDPVVWFGIIRAVALVLGFVATGVLAKRLRPSSPLGAARLLVVIDVVIIAAVLGFAFAGSFAFAIAAYWVAQPVRGLAGPVFDAWLNENTESETRATVNSIMGQADAVGQWTGGPAIGGIGTVFSIRAAIATSALILTPAIGLFVRAIRRGGREPALEEVSPATIEA